MNEWTDDRKNERMMNECFSFRHRLLDTHKHNTEILSLCLSVSLSPLVTCSSRSDSVFLSFKYVQRTPKKLVMGAKRRCEEGSSPAGFSGDNLGAKKLKQCNVTRKKSANNHVCVSFFPCYALCM